MSRESEMLAVMRWASPRSLRRRIRLAPVISLAMLTVFGAMVGFGIYTAAPAEGPPIISWEVGVAFWLLVATFVPVYSLWVVRVRRAMAAYAALTLAFLPAGIVILDGAIRFSIALAGIGATTVIAIGLLLGVVTLPLIIRTRQLQFGAAIKQGHLRRSLDRERALWDAQFDHDKSLSAGWLRRPGCLIRILPWIGPAIGMSLADVLGRSTANLVMVVGFIGIGYAFVYSGLVQVSVHLREFRRMEKELGRPIMLAEEPAGA